MSNFNKKGWTQIPVYTVDTLEDGRKTKWKAVKIGSAEHKRYLRQYKKWRKQKLENNRQFKAALRDRKRAFREMEAQA